MQKINDHNDHNELNDQQFGVILADPPWGYSNFGAAKHGAVRAHMGTIALPELCQVPVASWARRDAILLLWATWPKLRDAFVVAHNWGFSDYVTGIPWIKTSPSSGTIRTGIGFWFQSTSELLLVFRRGKPPSPDGNATKKRRPVKGLLCGSEIQFYAPVKEHSSKPLSVYDWARAKLKGPYLELFARNTIHGWTCWGIETGYELSVSGVRRVRRGRGSPRGEQVPKARATRR